MRFFLDENFPKAAAGILEGMGHEVFDLRGTDREGSEDEDIFAEAQQHGAVFLTTDRDFSIRFLIFMRNIPGSLSSRCGNRTGKPFLKSSHGC